MTIHERLLALRDEKNAAFLARLIPNLPPETVLGARTPELRSLARELRGTEEAARFLETLPHGYLEENQLHAFLIAEIRDYARCQREVERFLPFVDNWATCDGLRPKVFQKHRAELIEQVKRWLASGETYTVRFGLGMLMTHYLDADFRPEYLDSGTSPRRWPSSMRRRCLLSSSGGWSPGRTTRPSKRPRRVSACRRNTRQFLERFAFQNKPPFRRREVSSAVFRLADDGGLLLLFPAEGTFSRLRRQFLW